jgi:hypothetical protein
MLNASAKNAATAIIVRTGISILPWVTSGMNAIREASDLDCDRTEHGETAATPGGLTFFLIAHRTLVVLILQFPLRAAPRTLENV